MKKNPEIVNQIRKVVSEKLGREATIRKVNNRDQYFILDLAFSYFQKADRNRRNDYRSGFVYLKQGREHCLLFVVVATPIMFSFLHNNFDYKQFKNILIDTAKYRDTHRLTYVAKKEKREIKEQDINEFLLNIDEIEKYGFAKTAFDKNNSSAKGIGNLFVVSLAKGFKSADIYEIINLSWNLFLWLYPSKPLFNRIASLNRNLQNIEKTCEIQTIKKLPKIIKEKPCCGQIEGAHIIPHQYGGSDKLENGLWLCNTHHRLTEGKLEGQRTKENINVVFKK